MSHGSGQVPPEPALEKLLETVERSSTPAPWEEADNIPWNDPEFSRRMLREHLTQEHDAASRRSSKIDGHVAWIHGELLAESPTRILDLGCGPGLYATRFASLGHKCVGVDYSPASIDHARGLASEGRLRCTFTHGDIREADLGSGYGLAMLIYGEFNVFRPDDAARILDRVKRSLDDGGLLLLEPHTYAAVKGIGRAPVSWYSAESGVFSDDPHVCVHEHFWDADARAATRRFYVADESGGRVSLYTQSFQAYTRKEYGGLLREHGFRGVKFHPSLTGDPDPDETALMAIVARA
jgi:SAM-dependent methyltransferase